MDKNKDLKKVVPSWLENITADFIYNTFGKIIPKNMTPNQMTLLGALGSLLGIICAALVKISPLFLIGTIMGLAMHLICDDLDGYIAKKRNMSSDAGAYFDLITDILNITYLLIALAFSKVISFQVAVFLVPVYALLMFTAMNDIRYFNEFLFPTAGPIETHLAISLICIIEMIFHNHSTVRVFNWDIKINDIILTAGGIWMYIEMIRLQINLFVRLYKRDKNKADSKNQNS